MDKFEAEWAKMLNGENYDAVHFEFLRRLEETRQRIWEFNRMNPSNVVKLKALFRSIVADCGEIHLILHSVISASVIV